MTAAAQSSRGVRDVVQRMKAYTLPVRSAPIKLNQNESPFDFPKALRQEVLDRVAALPWNLYPEFEATALRSALGRSYGMTAESILAGNGSNELLGASIAAFVEPGRKVAFARPTFALYQQLIALAGGEAMPVDLDPRSGLLPLEALAEAVERDRADVVIVCSPNNPTGGVLPDGGIERLLATGAVVLFDRAYGDFHDAHLPPLHDRLVTLSTFSKAWGLAGLRLGWLASTASTCGQIRKAKLPYSLNIVSEQAAIVALENRRYCHENVEAIVAERERMVAELQTIEEIVTFPTRANFVTFRISSPRAQMFEALWQAGILVRDVSSYHGLADCLRVSIGSPPQNDRFLAALRSILENS
jgi:histidinol-phosphate aminotransferase